MIKTLQKYFQATEVAKPAEAETTKDDATMADVPNEGNGDAESLGDVVALQATVAALTEQLATTLTKNAELAAQVEAAVEFKAAQAKAAAEALVTARTAALAAIVGDTQAVSLQAATAGLDQSAFEAVVAAMSLKSKTETESPAFKEVGVEGQADAAKLVADAQGSRVMDYLKTITHENQAQ